MSLKGKWEYFRAIYQRYHKADWKSKQAMLNEFCLNTHYNRKYAIRLLNGPPPEKVRRARRQRRATYGHRSPRSWRRFGRRRVTHGRCG